MSLYASSLLAVSPVIGALAALMGWRTGERWLAEEAEARAERQVDALEPAHRPDGETQATPPGQPLPPLSFLALAALISGLVALGAVSAFAAPVSLGAALLGWAFVYAASVDVRARLLPDWPSFLAGVLGIVVAWMEGASLGVLIAFAGAASAGAGLALVALVMRRRMGREALGWGDIKLASAGGLLLGPVAIWTAIGAGAAATILWMAAMAALRPGFSLRDEVPFGPGLLAAIWLGWIADRMGYFPTISCG
jgi:leader peptidase (prepilin peptidase)/N-methyltransferase